MEKFFLRLFFAGEKLDIVDEQNVDVPVFVAETLRRGCRGSH